MQTFSELGLIGFYKFQNEAPVLVDVGAHHGSFLLPFARKGWRVIAFEPERENWEALLRNTAEFPNVTCINRAVSDENAQDVQFYVSSEHYGIHSLKPFHDTHQLAYSVTTVRLADALAMHDVTDVTCLKIDIEGADFLALRGFDFASFRPELVMTEFMDSRSMRNYGYDHHEVVKYMQARGYCAFVSEWAPISEYGREGEPGEMHTWLQCKAYPLDSQPAWGNLIFVPEASRGRFAEAIKGYIRELRKPARSVPRIQQIRKLVGMVPGARHLYRKIKSWRN